MPTKKTATAKKEVVTKDEVVKAPKKEVVVVVTHKTLNEALFAFQGEDLMIPRNGTGKTSSGGSYKYATLDDVMSITRKPLQKHGLMITQPMSGDMLVTILTHVPSNETIKSELPLGRPEKSQDLGARITYLRRYQIVSVLGLTIEDDTDAKPTDMILGGGAKAPEQGIVSTKRETTAIPATEKEESGLGGMTPHDSVTVAAEMTEQFKKAKMAVDNCMTKEALDLIGNKIVSSEKLNQVEKEALKDMIDRKTFETK